MGVHFLGKETPGDMTLEESVENLRGEEMLLSGAGRLSERKRVAPRAALLLYRKFRFWIRIKKNPR